MTNRNDTMDISVVTAWSMFILTASLAVARAEVEKVGYYELGAGSTVTYAAGPQTLQDDSGRGQDLQRQGEPLFVASTPGLTTVRAAGALQFDGKLQRYTRDGALFGQNDNFGLEAWVNAAQQNQQGLHGAAANGDGARGYVLGQMNDRWVAFVGAVGATEFDPGSGRIWHWCARATTALSISMVSKSPPARFRPPSIPISALAPAACPPRDSTV
jgi:hypothetical protein